MPQTGRSNGYCQSCNQAYGRENYRKNKERYFNQCAKRNKQLDNLINSYKSKPCADCGIQYPPYVMDFDHKEQDIKLNTISYMRRHKMAFKLIEEEIAKCEVVCSNCHRERTNTQQPARYMKT
jgi:hypothetical protein